MYVCRDVSHLHGVLDEPLALLHGQLDVPAAVVDGLRHPAQDEHSRVTLGLLSNVISKL